MEPRDGTRLLARLMGWFYLFTGVWPLLHIRSFEWATGPKTDRWLVKTVGALVSATGITLLMAARRQRVAPEVAALAMANAASLAVIDVVYVANKRIRPVYLLDAVVEVALLAAWARALLGRADAGGDDWMAGAPE